MRELWNWEKCKEKIRSLKGRLGFPDMPMLKFLEYTLNLEDGKIYDNLKKITFPPDSLKCKTYQTFTTSSQPTQKPNQPQKHIN